MIIAWVDFRLEGNIAIEIEEDEDGAYPKVTEDIVKTALDKAGVPGYLLRGFTVVYEKCS